MTDGFSLDALVQSRACWEAIDRDPSLVPYCGPEGILRRFQAGAVVSAQDCLTDQSLWIVEPIDHRAMRRLQWMLREVRP